MNEWCSKNININKLHTIKYKPSTVLHPKFAIKHEKNTKNHQVLLTSKKVAGGELPLNYFDITLNLTTINRVQEAFSIEHECKSKNAVPINNVY